MKQRVPVVAAWLVIIAIAFALSRASGLSLFATVAVVVLAVFVNGLVLTLEDDHPGGFDNPDGLATPGYVRVLGSIVRAVGIFALIATMVSIALALS